METNVLERASRSVADTVQEQGPRGIGASITRNEDARFLAGKGEYLADLNIPGTREVAFLRSPVAHGIIRDIDIPPEYRGQVFLLSDLGDVQPVRAILNHPDFRGSDFLAMASGRVRYVGECIAMCVAPSRAEAEDIVQQISLNIEELPVVVDALAAARGETPVIHEGWPDNRVFVSTPAKGNIDEVAARADIVIERDLRMNRQCVVSLEGRGVLAYKDRRLEELVVVYSSTQQPHIIRTVLAGLIGVPEHRMRVVAPDVGGGFGVKNNLQQEEVAIAALAKVVDFPVRWIEDRREHLTASAQAREHYYRMKLYAEKGGRLLGVDAEVVVSAGAYSIWPWSSAMECNMVVGIMPGPYKMEAYRGRGTTVVTNKPPHGPYRGVGRPGACFALERMMDELAQEVGVAPDEIRRMNMITAAEMPHLTIAGKLYDSGDFPQSVSRASAMIDVGKIAALKRENGKDGIYHGIGWASYVEQTAHGTHEWLSRNLTEVFGYEAATARFTPDGKLVLEVAIQNHGQGLETTLAQVAATELGVDPRDVVVRHGDTAVSPYGLGTFASRSMVMAGGAVGRACAQLAEKVKRIGAHFLQTSPEDVELRDNRVYAGTSSVPLSEVTRAAFRHAQDLPPGEEPGLQVSLTYQPENGTGAFSYATHAVHASVDIDTGLVKLQSPSPFTRYGIKGMGEGGAIGAPAAIANAVNDALAGLGVEINETPITPRRLLTAIARATERVQ